ncbi:MAG: Gfo/Idh/MocA family oxidoreductase [Ruminococcaceae bacterium]|nr:Gfo/Idh/MocA family oxidoreductase [Oscillospiraceae bacterium]
MMRKLNFALIGCGAIAVHHVAAMEHVDGAEFVAVYGAIPEQAKAFGEKYGLRVYDTLEEMLANPGIDVVTLCTPSGTHAELAIQAMTAGKHVVCEKPLALTNEDCAAVVEASRKYNRKCEVICQLRFAETVKAVKEAIDGGHLGKITNVSVNMKYWRTDEYYDASDWRGTWKYDGGGALMNQGIHGIDLLRFFMGSPVKISAICKTLAHNIEVEDTAVAIMEYENGAVGTIAGTTSSYPGYARRFELCGTKGSIVMIEDTIEKWDIETLPKPLIDTGRTDFGSSDPNAIDCRGHAKQFNDIVNAINNDVDVANGPESGAATVELILGIYEASRKGAQIDFKTKY